MYACQQVLVGQNKDLTAILKLLCEEAHKLTNKGIYYAIKLYFQASIGIGKFDARKA